MNEHNKIEEAIKRADATTF
ncbi:Protein of unknown function [Lactobacillus acidophilus DSM 9126]|nr:Protein of unknown function [Lactobacillus acidophilus CIRM-BIA 445]CDF73074.1 Protein of unknown function [Lactobacillus acidophilus DSM 9126]CDF75064.1 Protein of unknown function [Lactobacillus acidophilus DSM 20242]